MNTRSWRGNRLDAADADLSGINTYWQRRDRNPDRFPPSDQRPTEVPDQRFPIANARIGSSDQHACARRRRKRNSSTSKRDANHRPSTTLPTPNRIRARGHPSSYFRSRHCPLPGHLGWSELLEHERVILVAEGGSGKSVEMCQQKSRLTEAGRNAFFVSLDDLNREPLGDSLSPEEASKFQAWKADGTRHRVVLPRCRG